MRPLHKLKLSSFQVILLGFAAVILIGAFLLMLPISSKERVITPFSDALFTSTSAVCVTGLIVQDTATYWSYFGQAIILILIQIGGLGVVTVAASVSILAGRKIGLGQRSTMQEAMSAPSVGGIVRLTWFILKGVLIVEAIGMLAMLPVFCIDHGAKGIWMAVFHSISAFCNAGFDVMGDVSGQYSSLTAYAANPIISIVIMLLIIIGGIGFLTWEDIYRHKWHVKKYRTQSKIILAMTGVLIFIPTLYFFFCEFEEYAIGERILLSLFQAVTPRTAGFNTANLGLISEVGLLLMIFLMLVGGSPGSTAGGMKTTTLAVLFASATSVFRKKESAQIGDSTNENFLRTLGVDNYDVCIVTIGGDFQSSLETTSLLKELGAKKVVSRAERDGQAKFLLRNGADEIVYPEKQLASWMGIRYSADHILDYIELDGEHAIFEVTVPKEWIGMTVGQLDIRRKYKINIMGVKKNGRFSVSITPDTVLTEDKTLMVVGEYKALQKCFRI